jgi:hypothetical protein
MISFQRRVGRKTYANFSTISVCQSFTVMLSVLKTALGPPVYAVLGPCGCRRYRCTYRIFLVHHARKKSYGLPEVRLPRIFHTNDSSSHRTRRTNSVINVLMMYTINTGFVTGSVDIVLHLPVSLHITRSICAALCFILVISIQSITLHCITDGTFLT